MSALETLIQRYADANSFLPSEAYDDEDETEVIAAARAERAELVAALRLYFAILDQRERDENEYAAAGTTYCTEQLQHAQGNLRAILAKH
jgi:hypothetical protein